MPTKTINSVDEANLPKPDKASETYVPADDKEKEVKEFMSTRVARLKDDRKEKLPGMDRSIEDIWADADREYPPHELNGVNPDKKRLESDDAEGYRSRLVTVGQDSDWQSNAASPDFYVKVTTALAIMTDQNPEAVFLPGGKKYEATTALAYANWKSSWEVSGAKQQLKLFIFNLAKYGFAVGKTYPKLLVVDKKVMEEFYGNASDQAAKFKQKRLVKYNDLCRKSLNPWDCWISSSARPGDPLSIDDWYHEEHFTWDRFQQEFGDYVNAKFVKKGALSKTDTPAEIDAEQKLDDDGVTVGFYENQRLDLYVVWIPSQNMPLYSSPLPNDDGKLSLWMAPWTLRHDKSIYGIGLFEIIRQDSILFDRFLNMTMDQLTLAIYKMFFYRGTEQIGENGQLKVTPGKGEQVTDPANVKFLEVPGPGADAWRSLQFLQDRKDTISGVPAQLQGKFGGKTLGQDLQAKETALERLKAPLDFIVDALQEEAYITLSWQTQMLSTPEMLEWATPEDLAASLREFGLSDEEIQQYVAEAQAPKPNSQLLSQDGEAGYDAAGQYQEPKKYANVYKEVPLGLEKDDKGQLVESNKRKFYRFGVDLPLGHLDWRGIVRIKPQSILAPSKELAKRSDLELYNLVFPSIQAMANNPMLVPVLMPPIKAIIQVYDKSIDDWIDVKHFNKLYADASAPKAPPAPEAKVSLSVAYKDVSVAPNDSQKAILEQYLGIKVQSPLFVPKGGIGAPEAMPMGAPNAPPAVNEAAAASIEPAKALDGNMGGAPQLGV